MDILEQFTFLELLLLASIGLLVLVAIFSIIRYIKFEERLSLLLRHVAGLVIGLLDQTFMVIFNFEPQFFAVVILFDYVAYTLWFMLMPNLLEKQNQKLAIILWITLSSAVMNIPVTAFLGTTLLNAWAFNCGLCRS